MKRSSHGGARKLGRGIESGRYEGPLPLVLSLFQTLNGQGIRYCHWKSNCNLDQSMRGLTDLDLLVDRNHSLRFREILFQHNLKPVLSHPLNQYPAIEDYLGFDIDSGRLVHLHVHYQLILGEQFVKNYHLPLEQSFLECTHTYAGVKIPSPELEIIVLTIRALLKYRDRDFIKGILYPSSTGLPLNILKEFEYLLKQTTLETISSVLESQVDFLSRDIVLEFLTTIKMGAKPARVLYRLRKRIRRDLEPYQRYSRWRAAIRYYRIELLLRYRLVFRRSSSPKKKRLMSGGRTVALVGADGAGKSTIVSELSKWLSWRLTVHTYYMGSKRPSTVTRIVGWSSRMISYFYRACCVLFGEKYAKLLCGPQCLPQTLRLIATAKDRYNRHIVGQRSASQGNLVIYDRYPLEAVCIGDRFMDGPRIASRHSEEVGSVMATFAQIEENIYRRIRLPDCVLALQVSPSVSLQRKPDHRQHMIEAKCQALKGIEREGLCVTEIDADQPLEEVLLQAKKALWDLL